MPKKTESTGPADQQVLVKFYVSPSEHRLLKAMAAISDVTIADFCQKVVVDRIRALTSQMNFPQETGDKPRRG